MPFGPGSPPRDRNVVRPPVALGALGLALAMLGVSEKLAVRSRRITGGANTSLANPDDQPRIEACRVDNFVRSALVAVSNHTLSLVERTYVKVCGPKQ